MLNPFQWIAVLGMLVIALLFLLEVGRWRQMGQIMSRGQRVLRICTFIAVELLFVMMLVGPLVTARQDPLISLTYWSLCLALALSIVALALLIMLAALRGYSQLNRRAYQELKESSASRERGARPGDNGHRN